MRGRRLRLIVIVPLAAVVSAVAPPRAAGTQRFGPLQISGNLQSQNLVRHPDAGTYEYKYVLDGTRWRHDPGNRRQAGYYHNSVIEIGKVR